MIIPRKVIMDAADILLRSTGKQKNYEYWMLVGVSGRIYLGLTSIYRKVFVHVDVEYGGEEFCSLIVDPDFLHTDLDTDSSSVSYYMKPIVLVAEGPTNMLYKKFSIGRSFAHKNKKRPRINSMFVRSDANGTTYFQSTNWHCAVSTEYTTSASDLDRQVIIPLDDVTTCTRALKYFKNHTAQLYTNMLCILRDDEPVCIVQFTPVNEAYIDFDNIYANHYETVVGVNRKTLERAIKENCLVSDQYLALSCDGNFRLNDEIVSSSIKRTNRKMRVHIDIEYLSSAIKLMGDDIILSMNDPYSSITISDCVTTAVIMPILVEND